MLFFFTGIHLRHANLCDTIKKKSKNKNLISTRNKTELSLIVKEPIQNHESLHHWNSKRLGLKLL